MKYLSNQLLDDLYAKSEININKAIIEWQQLPNIRLITQPGSGQWSAAQCLEHLNSYGRYYLPAIEKALAISKHSTASTHFKSGWLGNYFYKMMLVEKNGKPKKKLTAPKAHQPGMQLNGSKVVSEFISQQELLEQLLQMAQSADINKIRIPISISPFIKLKLGDVFLFLIAHINRHLAQAQRALDTTCYSLKSAPIA